MLRKCFVHETMFIALNNIVYILSIHNIHIQICTLISRYTDIRGQKCVSRQWFWPTIYTECLLSSLKFIGLCPFLPVFMFNKKNFFKSPISNTYVVFYIIFFSTDRLMMHKNLTRVMISVRIEYQRDWLKGLVWKLWACCS